MQRLAREHALRRVTLVSAGRCVAVHRQATQLRPEGVEAIHRAVREAQYRHSTDAVIFQPDGEAVENVAGSDVEALRDEPAAAWAEHYGAVARLIRDVGESSATTIALLAGRTSGWSAGLALHSNFTVATEQTALSMPGPAEGRLAESFALYHAARLPGALGMYLALTGAALSGPELRTLGLATHLTESQALERVAGEVGTLHSMRDESVSRRLDEVSLEVANSPRTSESDALHYSAQIDACFSAPSLTEIVSELERGASAWHEQVLAQLRASSPLALHLTFALISRAAAAPDAQWPRLLLDEAAATAAFTGAPDAGVAAEADGDGVPAWEHASVEEVSDDDVRRYLPDTSE